MFPQMEDTQTMNAQQFKTAIRTIYKITAHDDTGAAGGGGGK